MQDISFKEYSFVNQPADQKSGVRSTKVADGDAPVAASDDWIAKSSAFVLHMDNEDIVSIEENESILKSMKKKDSKTTYLHTKGAFLTALALHESESDISETESLLSNEDSEIDKSEEISTMDDVTKDEDILAVATGLSEDLSNIAASGPKEEEDSAETASAETEEAAEQQDPEEDAEGSEEVEESKEEEAIEATDDKEQVAAEENSNDDSEEADVQTVDSENAEEPQESSEEDSDEVQEEVVQDSDLTTSESSDEQDVEQLTAQVALLEKEVSSLKDENSKLKSALHMTLVERVVDTKIALGLSDQADRDEMLKEHAPRTASSLADTLRDLATLPVKGSKRLSEFLVSNEFTVNDVALSAEANVLTVDQDEVEESDPNDSFEQVLVDTLMGRRKL